MLRLVLFAAIGGAVVHVSGVLEDGPAQLRLMFLPLSAAVAWVLLGNQ